MMPEPGAVAPFRAPAATSTETGDSAPAARQLLARLRDVMASSEDPEHRLDQIVRMIGGETGAEVCSCYVMRAGEVLELFATVGLNPEAVHRTRLRVGEGIVGWVAAQARPIGVADARSHPAFAYRPETGEDPFRSLLGVPILRGGRVRGVLVIQHVEPRMFSDLVVETLETVAMVVAELIAADGMLGPQERSEVGDAALMPSRLTGIGLAPGLGMGFAVLHQRQLTLRQMVADDPEAERTRLGVALAGLHQALDAMLDQPVAAGPEPRDILESYRMIAADRGWLARIREAINSGLTAEAAVIRVQDDLRQRMSQIADPYLRERLQDFDDLAYRLLNHLAGRSSAADGLALPDDIVLVARTLGPAELLDYDHRRLRGLVLVEGSAMSHVAVVARALDIPMVGQVPDLLNRIDPLDPLIVDGDHAQVLVRPGDDAQAAFADSMYAIRTRERLYAETRHLPAVSRDGIAVAIHLNCGLQIDLPHLDDSGAVGIGLFRTEIPFMVQSGYPDVATQTALYAQVLDRAGDRPVLFRTLDIGGDKHLPYFPLGDDVNPALGWRGIRIGIDRPALLRRQIRALLHAAAGRPLSVMFPMIAEVAEFEAARRIVEIERARAAAEGRALPARLALGVMVEVPSLLFQLDALLPRVDFLSVGSNDLTQYLFACDRADPRLAGRFDPLSPPMMGAFAHLVRACEAGRVPLSVCGEMAGTPLGAMALIGLGLRSLSMAAPAVGPVKTMLRSLDVGTLVGFLDWIRRFPDHSYRDRLAAFARDHGVAV